MNRVGLGIDAGGSSTGWLLVAADGTVLGKGRTGSITGHVFTPDGALSGEGERSLAALRGLLAEVRGIAVPTGVVLGAAGLDSGSAAAQLLAETVAGAFTLPAGSVITGNDMDIAYRSVFEPGEGVIVYAGTGSIAWHIPRSGPPLRAGGHGYLIDDAGGGYWIGRRALATVLRWQDELGLPPGRPLAREVYRQLGSSDWPDIRTAVYGEGRARVAALAPAVLRASGLGDEAATEILQAAGTELGRLANVMLRRLGQILPVALLGGIANLGPRLTDALQASLPGMSGFSVSTVDPVQAAAALAVRLRSTDD